jgi:urease subunit gamma/beta
LPAREDALPLTPTEQDRLLLFTAAELARARRARGLRLNIPEATALVADTVCEAARDGARLAEAIDAGRSVLGPRDVLPGVADVVTTLQVEAVFEDGTRLAVVDDPFRVAELAGDAGGAGEPVGYDPEAPGAILPAAGHPPAVPEPVLSLPVRNTSPVPISVTSHFHFFEVNPRLAFDRDAAYGTRLAVPAGSSVRFDPGATVQVELVPIGGERVAVGFAGLVDGPLDAPGARRAALEKARATGFLTTYQEASGTADGEAPHQDATAQGAAAHGATAQGAAAQHGVPSEREDQAR